MAAKTSLKILLITDGITPFVTGGMQRHSANLAKYLTLAGQQVTLVHCVAHYSKMPSDEEVNESLFNKNSIEKLDKIISFKFPAPGKLPGHYLRNSYQFSKYVFEEVKDELLDYDFIVAKGFSGWKLLEQKRKGMRMPPVGVNLHGYEMYQQQPDLKHKWSAKMLRTKVQPILEMADYVFSYGGKINDLLIQKASISIEKIISIPGGIDNGWLYKENNNIHSPVRFVFMGRYERRKGIEELNEAISLLPASVNAVFSFIGPIPDDKQLKSEKVRYLGEFRDAEKIKEVLREHDVLLCPSHSEGMPNVILEGMASGLAIIATDVGAVNCMTNGENGILLPVVTVKGIIDSIEKMSNNDNNLNDLKQISSSKILDFEWTSIIQRTIEELLKRI